MLEGLGNILIEQSLHFEFKTCNNQAGYEVLIIEMNLAKEMGENICSWSDSQLITNQVICDYQTKKANLTKYLYMVQEVTKIFKHF